MQILRINHKCNQRHGITLLFVISMIVLFLLMATTFVVVSHDYLTDATRRGRLELKGVRAPVSIQNVFYEFVRGPSLLNTNSPLRGHSLLADQYGYGYFAYISSANMVPSTDRQMIEIRLKDVQGGGPSNRNRVKNIAYDPVGTQPPSIDLNTLSGDPANGVPGYFNGQVLSIVSGLGAGISTRIIDHRIEVGMGRLDHVFVVIPEWFDNSNGVGVLIDARVIINGRPFSGYGAGFDRTTNSIYKEALLPNFRSFEDPANMGINVADSFFEDYVKTVGVLGNLDLSGNVSVNEDYDTYDWNNMFLGGYGDVDGDPGTNDVAIPSFHRPELLAAANAMGGSIPENRYSFRPVVGSTANTNFPNGTDPGTGQPYPFADRPLDVDNLVDGDPDSVWIDIGLAIHSVESGRLIKPLVAALIIDLDRRLNVNAHGSLIDADSADDLQLTRLQMLGNPTDFPRGLGMGPAEVSLRALGENYNPSNPVTWDYTKLFQGDGTYAGRYGNDNNGGDNRPGVVGRDTWSEVRFVGYPDSTWPAPNLNNGLVGGIFTSNPLDIYGRFGYGFPDQLDPNHSVPVGTAMADIDMYTTDWVLSSEIADSPYEMNLLDTTYEYNDAPFVAGELERLLRLGDNDSAFLPGRLASLIPDAARGQELATTHSFEVPRAPMVPALAGGFQTVPERLYGILTTFGNLTQDQARIELQQMLAPEVMRGLRMNVNRMFGDGQDNDGDDVFDEHWIDDDPSNPDIDINESRFEEVVHYQGNPVVAFDHDNDGMPQSAIDYRVKQIFARQLYTLVWMATGQPNGGTISPPDMNLDGMSDEDDARALAQWCINVVDFRDPDSINTPFEYDLNPFNGWDVDGDIDPTIDDTDNFGNVLDPLMDKGVVWGAEPPELLFTEVIATHDRKSEDLPNGGGTVSGGNDSDYDSDAVPTASCFVELYSPHLTSFNSQKLHSELYTNGGIDLARSASNVDSVPVWRMAFTKEQGQDPMGSGGRRVYFVKPSDALSAGEPGFPVEDSASMNENYYFPDSSIPIDVIPPNGYAVIGSAGVEDNDAYRTTFGRRTDAFVDHATMHAGTDLKINRTRQIRLVPGEGFEIQDGDVTTAEPLRECVAIPLNRSGHVSLPGFMTDGDGAIRSFGLSDPAVGYVDALQGVAPGITAAPMSPIGGIPEGDCYIFDQVLAQPADVLTNHDLLLFDDGTHGNYRWVALQRLANPQAPYDPVENPYITVDEKPIDLVVFNGSEPGDEPGLPAAPDDVFTHFKTVERGETDQPPGASRQARERRLLWKPEWSSESPTRDMRGTPILDHIFDFQFIETLGEMNETYRDTMGMEFVDIAWPALSWNNRPFVSQYELALVPGGSGQQLYGPHRPGVVRVGVNDPLVDVPYLSTFEIMQNFTLPGGTYDPATSSRHLLPFRDATNSLARVFDFLEVPSRFIGTEMDFNANNFQGWEVTNELAGINAPYHTVSRRRNPGKININTVLNEEVWNGLIGDYATMGTSPMTYGELVASRRGTAATTVTDFDVPFRPVDFGGFAPPGVQRFTTPVEQYEATVQRSRDGMPGNPRLFEYENTASFNDTSRSAVFAESAMSRIGNIATIRSSVFAIWITVGYFEVDNNGLLGAEVGVDENSITRHRGFFIYDRSIPVAFEPGNNHNVERGILVQSYFE